MYGGNSYLGGEYAKNVYLGETRIVAKLVSANEIRAWEEVNKIYFYHSDHLGSASLITDENGNEFQRLAYTPYGEGRGLIHSNRGRDKESDYSIPRSKQCFILPDEDNERFFDTLEKWGVEDNTILKGTLYEFLKGER